MDEAEARRIARERDHGAMMRAPGLWPVWPYLPLKHPVQCDSGHLQFPRTAVLVECHDGLRLMRDVVVFALPADALLGNLPVVTVGQVLAEGWEVD